MKKKILTILLTLTSVVGYAQTQKTPPEGYDPDKVEVFSFVVGDDVFMLGLNHNDRRLKEVIDFIDANKVHIDDGSMPIFVYGYCARGGSETTRTARVKRMSNYVKGELIRLKKAKESNFVTFNSLGYYSETPSNAVVVKFYLPFNYETRQPKFIEKPHLVPELMKVDESKKEPVATPVSDSLKAEVVVEPSKQEPVAEPIQEQKTTPQTVVESTTPPTKIQSANNLRWYAGIEGGVSLGVSTLSSFTPKGGAGWNVGVVGGYRISPLLSAEVGISFGGLKLGASKCCEDYFLGTDGVRYLGHVAGVDSYSYRDIYSSVSMQQYAIRLNVDMLQIVNPDWNKRWSLNVSPAIYGINTTATLKTSNTTVIKRDSQFQFAAGAGIGVGYQITQNLGIGLRSGALWVFGKRYDGIAPTDHKENLIWNNTLTLTWRFGCNK